MKNHTALALISVLTLSAHCVYARETVTSVGIGTGFDYSNRVYDDSEIEDERVPPPQDERGQIIVTPVMSVFTETTDDSALLSYQPTLGYDVMDSESNDINHEALVGYHRELTDIWDLKIYDVFKDTDEYETNSSQQDYLSDGFLDELTSSIPSMNNSLRDDFGRRRYSLNEFDISTGLTYYNKNRLVLGYGWDHLDYDEDDTDSDTYQNYDKYNMSLALSHEINPLWTVKGYTQYVRGVYDTDDLTDDDLDEYHLGSTLTTDIIESHPMMLSYDFSESNYDDEDIDNSQIHKLTLGYQLITTSLFDISLGAGPTYTKMSDSIDSWDANGYFNVSLKTGRGSLKLVSDIGTQFDNFSGTDERALTDYWQSRLELTYPIERSLTSSVYCGYRDETRNEVATDTEVDIDKVSAGAGLNYQITDNLDAGLSYDFTDQESDSSEDSDDEHRVQLMFSFKTDLLKW